MKNLDIEISEKVAEEASKQMNQLKKQIESNKDVKLSILQDVIQDIREQRKFLKSICALLIILLFIIISGSFMLGMYNQKLLKDCTIQNAEKIFEFVSNTDFNFNAEMNTDNDSKNNGNKILSVSRNKNVKNNKKDK